jgi:alpha-tubulin suppressor-like RCC1 family protein
MSTEIKKYKILNKLNPNFLQKIRSFFILVDACLNYSGETLIFTDDGNVFVLGNNSYGRLGLGHNNAVKEPTILPELCGNITKITYGFSHVIALTESGKIFCWGRNDCGQLGNGSKSKNFNKPQLNDYLSDETIVDLSCGDSHSLALTKSGFVYAWG